MERYVGVETGFNRGVLDDGLAAVQNYIDGGMMNPSAGKSCRFGELKVNFHMSLAPSFVRRELACVLPRPKR